jgi:hypothetical protein
VLPGPVFVLLLLVVLFLRFSLACFPPALSLQELPLYFTPVQTTVACATSIVNSTHPEHRKTTEKQKEAGERQVPCTPAAPCWAHMGPSSCTQLGRGSVVSMPTAMMAGM